MWVTVWYQLLTATIGVDEFVSLDTPLCRLTHLFPSCDSVEIRKVQREPTPPQTPLIIRQPINRLHPYG